MPAITHVLPSNKKTSPAKCRRVYIFSKILLEHVAFFLQNFCFVFILKFYTTRLLYFVLGYKKIVFKILRCLDR